MGGFVFLGEGRRGHSLSTVTFDVIFDYVAKNSSQSDVVQEVLDPYLNGGMDSVSFDGLSDADVSAFYEIFSKLRDEYEGAASFKEWEWYQPTHDAWDEILAFLRKEFPFLQDGRASI